MSKIPTYVKMADGLYYKDPLLKDGSKWFICFDDEEPPELVIAKQWGGKEYNINPETLLNEIGIKFSSINFRHQSCRYFTGGTMKSAYSYYITITEAPPITYLVKGIGQKEKPKAECVYYEFD